MLISLRRHSFASLALVAALAFPAAAARADNPQLDQMRDFVELMTHYYELIGTIHSVAADPDKNAVLQLTKLKDYLEQSGQRDRVPELLRQIAERSPRATVRNAATMMLADALSDRGDKRAAADVMEKALLGKAAP